MPTAPDLDFEATEDLEKREAEEIAPSLVVGIGASAGGLDPLERFFRNIPEESGMAFVVVQHLSPDFKSMMDELLARHTNLPIHLAEDGMRVEANSVYLIPAKKNLIIEGSTLRLMEQADQKGLNLPIDVFFRSLAQDWNEKSVAIVLSGTGSDGSRGIQDVHEAGGLVVVQDLETADFDGMPRSAIATGLADIVTEPSSMARRILQFSGQITEFDERRDREEVLTSEDEDMAFIFRLFRSRYGIDFTYYRSSTIHRRLERRVKLTGTRSLAAYISRLEDDPQELESLYRDLLVEVTHFFRDAEAFEVLSQKIIPQIIEEAPEGTIRVWVPGCATGEEAYTLAMLFLESARNLARDVDLKVFATDVHRQSLETASSGVYSHAALAKVPEILRHRYFNKHGEFFHVSKDLRQSVIFAPHDLTKDPPFTKIDLISCRNVLIYLEPIIQRKVLSLFHFGLKVRGTLFLGPSETIGDLAKEFETINAHWRIFNKLRDVRLSHTGNISMQSPIRHVVGFAPSVISTATRADKNWIVPNVYEDLLTKYVPPSLLVNGQNELVHSFGPARQFLVQPEGKPTLDITKMVEGDLRMAIHAGLHRARQEESRVAFSGVRAITSEGEMLIRVVVEPYHKDNERDKFCLVCLEDEGPAPEVSNDTLEDFEPQDESIERIATLERELGYTKESLQATVEELETANEELQSTNEELVASNEELQSTNEELHSVNEELYTVNAEHQRKIEELMQLTADMDNLLKATEIGTVFLDCDLRIRKFTPAISAAFNVLDQDVGRPIDHIASNLDNPDLLDDVRKVLQNGQPSEAEVCGRDGTFFHQRIRPYRTTDKSTDGVVLTFTDVSHLREAREELRSKVDALKQANKELQNFAYAVSHDLAAPARRIVKFGELLVKQVDAPINEEAQQSLDAMTRGAARLNAMIDSLLAYSRVHTRGQPFHDIDVETLLADTLRTLAPQIDDSGARIVCEEMPAVHVDSAQLQNVFRALLSNAIKFCTNSVPQITISATDVNNQWQFAVSDNGIGIRKDDFDAVFVMFKQLSGEDEFPGIGAGLSIAKRIVGRHGGRLWLESKVDKGSTFYFTIPKKENTHGQRL